MFSQNYIQDLTGILELFPHECFETMVDILIEACDDKRNIFVMGNGGSAATASHWACDINKGCSFGKRRRFRMICLNDNIATMLAYGNDISFDSIFVEQLKNFFRPEDVVIGISGSGNSANVLKAIDYANKNDGITIGLCGFDGGRLYHMAEVPILANIDDMQKVEDLHMIIAHMAMQRVWQVFSSEERLKLVQQAGA